MSKENSKRYCIHDKYDVSYPYWPASNPDKKLEGSAGPYEIYTWASDLSSVESIGSLQEAFEHLEAIRERFPYNAHNFNVIDTKTHKAITKPVEDAPKPETPINLGPGAVISDCNFDSNDKYTINFADSLVALAKAVEQNAKAIQDICRMVINSDKINNPFIRLEKNNEN